MADQLDVLLDRVRAAAERRDRTGEGLDQEIGWLRARGLLAEAIPAAMSGRPSWSDDPLAIFALLRRIGAASLPLGRLFEGHINTLQLIGLYGSASLQQRCTAAALSGALFGVWGADAAVPLQAEPRADGFALTGMKSFCSGLGLVEWALVSAWTGDDIRLLCVDVRDQARADNAQWQVSGMRATHSGSYDFGGLCVATEAVVGGADDYFAEPHFLGGMYRMCAVQVGGLDELLVGVAAALQRRGKGEDPLAQLRLGQIASFAMLAASATTALARSIAAGAPAAQIARDAVLMREGVERCIIDALAIADRALGTEMHREPSATSRLRRDLSVYIRQAAVDDRLAAVGRWLMTPANRGVAGPGPQDL